MTKYLVCMPITGVVYLEVEAESKSSAVEAFYDKVSDIPSADLDIEWEFCEHVTTGNVTRVMQNDVSVEKVK